MKNKLVWSAILLINILIFHLHYKVGELEKNITSLKTDVELLSTADGFGGIPQDYVVMGEGDYLISDHEQEVQDAPTKNKKKKKK